jgi:hypothetical protein
MCQRISWATGPEKIQHNFRRFGMTRGPVPWRALELAQKIAEKRGFARHYERGPGMIADFSITTPACNAEVRIKRMGHVRCTHHWLEREAAEQIAGLKLFPSSREISRELWIYSPEYFWRFFRVCDDGLAELGRDGAVLPQKSLVPKRKPERNAGPDLAACFSFISGTVSLTGTIPVPASGDAGSPISERS